LVNNGCNYIKIQNNDKILRPDSDKYYSYIDMETLWDDSKCSLNSLYSTIL